MIALFKSLGSSGLHGYVINDTHSVGPPCVEMLFLFVLCIQLVLCTLHAGLVEWKGLSLLCGCMACFLL